MIEITGFIEETLLVALGFIVLAGVLYWLTGKLVMRTRMLRVARLATEDFYNSAERILSDPATPESVKHIIVYIAEAVTRKEAGQIALDCIVDSIVGDGALRRSNPPGALINDMELLRKTRGDLHECVTDAMRAAMSAILLSYGEGHDRISMEYRAIHSERETLALANKVSRAAADLCADIASRDRRTTAAA